MQSPAPLASFASATEPESPETRPSGKAPGPVPKERLCGSPQSFATVASSPARGGSPQSITTGASSPGLSTPSPVKRAEPVKRKRVTPLADGPPFWSCFSTPESVKPQPAKIERRTAPTPLADGPPFWSCLSTPEPVKRPELHDDGEGVSTPESVRRPGLHADGDCSPRTPPFQKVSKPVQHDLTSSPLPPCDKQPQGESSS